MKSLQLLLILALFSKNIFSTSLDGPIGKERINSAEYPKFLLNSTFNTLRYGGITTEPMGFLNHTFGLSFGFDVGIFKYLHAGASLGMLTSFTHKSEPVSYRFNMFIRPLITFFDKLSLYTRIGAGLGIIYDPPVESLVEALPPSISASIKQKYSSKYYADISPGVHGLATVGIEYFPLTRVGFSLEWGILAEYIHVSKSEQLRKKLEKLTGSSISDNSPKSFGYFTYELPVSLNINIIF